MHLSKKILAGTLACTTLVGSAVALSGCGNAYALKTDNAEISSGVYRYCLFSAYQNATYSVEDYTQPILSQKINGTPAEEWIRETALTYLKPILVVEDKMKELKLSLPDETRYNAKEAAATDWKNYKDMFESYGITQDDYQYVMYDYSAKYSTVFEAIYGEGGEKEVSREDMEKYFKENYADVDYIVASTTKDDGTAMSDDEIEAVKKEFAAYAKEINNGDKTIQEVDKEYTASIQEESTSSEASSAADDTSSATEAEEETNLHSVTGSITVANSYPEAMETAVKKLKNGKAQMVDASDTGYIVLVQKHNINDAVTKFFDNEDEDTKKSNRFQILVDMRQEDYTEYMTKLAEDFDESRITWNDAETTNLDLKALFEPDSLTSSEESAETSSAADAKEETASTAEEDAKADTSSADTTSAASEA